MRRQGKIPARKAEARMPSPASLKKYMKLPTSAPGVDKKPGNAIPSSGSKNIGRIFRTGNIIEYKSPEDYFSPVVYRASAYKLTKPRKPMNF